MSVLPLPNVPRDGRIQKGLYSGKDTVEKAEKMNFKMSRKGWEGEVVFYIYIRDKGKRRNKKKFRE